MTVRVVGSAIDPDLTAQAAAPSAISNTSGSIVPRSTESHVSVLSLAAELAGGVFAATETHTAAHTPTTASNCALTG